MSKIHPSYLCDYFDNFNKELKKAKTQVSLKILIAINS